MAIMENRFELGDVLAQQLALLKTIKYLQGEIYKLSIEEDRLRKAIKEEENGF